MIFRKFGIVAAMVVVFNTSLLGLTGGPTQPEFASFEPVDVTDLVNLPTGDLTYVLPLGEVKTPGGVGYPVTLAYHAGILHEQEATWVGLGWTLNPGAINRVIRGFADDYNGEITTSYMYNAGASGWNFNLGVGYNGISASIGWNEKGFQGVTSIGYSIGFGPNKSLGVGISYNVQANSLSLGFEGFKGIGKGFGINGNVGLTVGPQGMAPYAGVSLGYSKWSKSGTGLGANIGMNVSANGVTGSAGASLKVSDKSGNVTSLGSFSLNTRGGAGFSIAGGGANSGSAAFSSAGLNSWSGSSCLTIPIPLPSGLLTIDIAYSWWGWYYRQMTQGKAFGTIYSIHNNSANKKFSKTVKTYNPVLALLMAVDEDAAQAQPDHWEYEYITADADHIPRSPANIPPADFRKLWDRNEMIKNEKDFSFPAQDMYTVTGQGISGTFKPYISHSLVNSRIDYDDAISIGDAKNAEREGIIGIPVNKDDPTESFSSFLNRTPMSIHPKFTNSIIFKMCVEKMLNAVDNVVDGITYSTIPENAFDNTLTNFNQRIAGTRIDPVFGLNGFSSDHLGGFVITDQEGKTYYYTLPLHNLENITYTTTSGTIDPNQMSYRKDQGVYATTWLLRAITGPDYIKMVWHDDFHGNKREEVLLPHDGDYGYWVKFNYEYGPPVVNTNGSLANSADENDARHAIVTYPWRDPYEGFHELTDPDNAGTTLSNVSYGLKEITYLKSIESPTDVAYFRTTPRYDGQGTEPEKYPLYGVTGIPHDAIYFPADPGDAFRYMLMGTYAYTQWGKTGLSIRNDVISTVVNADDWIDNNTACPYMIIKIPKDKFSAANFHSLDKGTVLGGVFFSAKADYHDVTIWACGERNDVNVNGELVLLKDAYHCDTNIMVNGTREDIHDVSFEMDPAFKWIWSCKCQIPKCFSTAWLACHCLQGFTNAIKCFYAKEKGEYTYIFACMYKEGVINNSGQCNQFGGALESIVSAVPMGPLQIKKGWCRFKVTEQDEDDGGDYFCDIDDNLNSVTDIAVTGAYLSGNMKPLWTRNYVTRYQKKLDRISWYSKTKYPFLIGGMDPEQPEAVEFYANAASGSIESYKHVNFHYDHSLARETPNSTAPNGVFGQMNRGRLTLRSVQFGAGPANENASMPPYIFNYQNSDVPYLGTDKEDLWGFSARSYDGAKTTYLPKEVNYATDPQHGICWNLSKVYVPSGGTIEIEYERDKGHGPEAAVLEWIKKYPAPVYKDIYSMYKHYFYPTYPQEYPIYRSTGNGTIFEIQGECDIPVGALCIFKSDYIWEKKYCDNGDEINIDSPLRHAYCFKVVNAFSGALSRITLDRPFSMPIHKAGECNDGTVFNASPWKLVCIARPGSFWGGDLRVASITTSSFAAKTFTVYRYPGAGVFEVLPSNAIPYAFNEYCRLGRLGSAGSYFTFDSTYVAGNRSTDYLAYPLANTMECRYNKANSQFIYPLVDVYNGGGGGNMCTNGIKRYHHRTCKDSVIINEQKEPLISQKLFQYTINNDLFPVKQIIDRTGIISMCDSIEFLKVPVDYRYNETDDVRPYRYKVSRTKYLFSEQLAGNAGVYYGGLENTDRITEASKKILGISRERTLTKKYNYKNPAGQEFAYSGLTDVIVSQPYMVSSETVLDNVTTENSNGLFDATTGNSMATLLKNSDGRKKVDLTIPYHYICPEDQSLPLIMKNTYSLVGGSVVADVSAMAANAGCKDIYIKNILDAPAGLLSATAQHYELKDVSSVTIRNTVAPLRLFYPDISYAYKGSSTFNWPWADFQGWQNKDRILAVDKFLRPQSSLDAKDNATSVQYLPVSNNVTAMIQGAQKHAYAILTGDYDDIGHYEEQIINGKKTNVFVSSAYLDSANGWFKGAGFNGGSVKVSNAQAHFGTQSIHVKSSYGPGNDITKVIPDADYVFSVWIYPVNSNGIRMVVEGRMNGSLVAIDDAFIPAGKLVLNKWNFITKKFPASYFTSRGFIVTKNSSYRIWIGNHPNDAAMAEFCLDDIRFYPKKSQVTTFYYNQQLCLPITFVDANNKCKRFDYDAFGRLTAIKNNSGVTLKTASYSSALKGIVVYTPEVNSIYPRGAELPVTWAYQGVGAKLRFSLSTDGGTTWYQSGGNSYFHEKIQLFPWDNAYTWTIPTNVPPSNNCIIKIQDMSAGGQTGLSQRFTIVQPSAAITSPAYGSHVQEESIAVITLDNAFTTTSTIDIYFYNGKDIELIKSNLAYTGGSLNYEWQIPYQGKQIASYIKIVGKNASGGIVGEIYSHAFFIDNRSNFIKRWIMDFLNKR